MSNYTIHKLQKGDFKLLIPLMEDCFGMEVNIDYFKWKFIQNPSGLVEGYYAKDENNEVIAYYGLIPETFIINGKKRIIYQSCDTMTHSSHRRKGLFKKLALSCYEALEKKDKFLVYGFGGKTSTPGFLKFGWNKVFNLKYYFYPSVFNIAFKLSHNKVLNVLNHNEIEHLTLKSNENKAVHSHKTHQVYNWRVSNPRFNYKTIGLKTDSENFSDYITYYISNDVIILFDFFISTPTAGKNLFNYLKAKMKKDTAIKGIVTLCQENTEYTTLLKKYNFINNPLNIGPLHDKIPFIFYTTSEEQKLLNNEKKWLINSFDHDAL